MKKLTVVFLLFAVVSSFSLTTPVVHDCSYSSPTKSLAMNITADNTWAVIATNLIRTNL